MAPEGPSGTIYLLDVGDEPPDLDGRDTIGGRPVLPVGQPWPACDCGERMVCFFQIDVPTDIPIFGGDHLTVFQCPKHNDAAISHWGTQLPERFWDAPTYEPLRFWRLLIHGQGAQADQADAYLEPRPLVLRRAEEQIDHRGRGRQGFKIGGVPSWAQDPEHYTCSCGAELAPICQVPDDFGFAKQPDRPPQPYSIDDEQYTLFLGNEVYIVACPEHCHPAAAWPINQKF